MSIFYSLIKQLIIIFPLLFFPILSFFLSWQIAVNFLFSIVLRMIVINLYCLDRMTISLKNIMEFIQSKYKIFMPLFFISIINVALTQSDKIFVGTSNFELFKFYALGSLLASSLTIISNAIGTSYFSKLYSDSINIKDGKQSEIFYLVYYVLMVILIPIFIFMSSLSNEILLIWLKYPEFVNNTIVIFNILLFANFITFIQTPSFHLFISKGLPKYNLYFGIVSASILVPGYYLLSLRGLIMEIAIMYLITQFVTSFVYTYYSCKILEWQFSYKKIVLYPLIYILGVIFLSLFIHFLHFSAYIKISISVLSYAFYAWLSHNKLKKLYEFNT